MRVLEPPLDAISRVARPYPAWVLDGCETGLCLFSAAFLGHNDAIHMARADLEITLVDIDEKVLDMAELYQCSAVVDDAWNFARFMRHTEAQWDVVSLDPFTNLFDKVAADLPLWCSLARKTVVIGSGLNGVQPPDGWQIAHKMQRAANVYWTVLERA